RLVDPNASVASLLKADLEAGLQACMTATTQYPNVSRFAQMLAAAQEQRMAQRALSSNQPELSSTYLLIYPSGRFTYEVKAHIATLGGSPETRRGSDEPIKRAPYTTEHAAIPASDLSRMLQLELKRVGCNSIDPRGRWGISSVQALTAFNHYRRSNYDTSKPTIEAVDFIKSVNVQVCPLICGRGERVIDNKCAKISCGLGFNLDQSGKCRPKDKNSNADARLRTKINQERQRESVKKRKPEIKLESFAQYAKRMHPDDTGPWVIMAREGCMERIHSPAYDVVRNKCR
ncbi:hypothetical protein SAMN04488144_14532, partial [Methylobacterium sp. 190mf]